MRIEGKFAKFNYLTCFIFSQFYFNFRRSIKREIRIGAVLTLHSSNMHKFQSPQYINCVVA